MYDTEQERKSHESVTNSSVWGFVAARRDLFTNFLYAPPANLPLPVFETIMTPERSPSHRSLIKEEREDFGTLRQRSSSFSVNSSMSLRTEPPSQNSTMFTPPTVTRVLHVPLANEVKFWSAYFMR